MGDEIIVCKPVELPLECQVEAVMNARAINPKNVKEGVLERVKNLVERTNAAVAKLHASPLPIGERRLAIARLKRTASSDNLTIERGRRWSEDGGTFTVAFLDNPSAALRKKILSHMNAWSGEVANVSFVESNTDPLVRIGRFDKNTDPTSHKGGHWSNIGTDILSVPDALPTLNLQGFSDNTADSEFRRVVRHEAGHTLGFIHEHLRQELIDRLNEPVVIDEYSRMYDWTEAQTRARILTAVEDKSVMGTTDADDRSIMCYQVEPFLTLDLKGIPGGEDLTAKDRAFAAACYPPVI